ncbi:MAG TPA: PEP-CTERM sorting domain-containing protein [Chthoniobacteraceae bacterium]|nr:PEP-CTERM sorting domain-containing protein [Chthoniobacteraceae bacterium]
MRNILSIFNLSLVATAVLAAVAQAAPQSQIGHSDPGLGGTVITDYWNEMTRTKYKIPQGTNTFAQIDPTGPQDLGHPGVRILDYLLAQNRPAGAQLHRVAGSGIVAEVGLYDVAGMGTGLDLAINDPIIQMLQSGLVTREYLATRTDITEETFTDPFQLSIRSADVVAGLETVVFQINLFGMAINEGYMTPFEVTQALFPVTLSINGTTQTFLPDFVELLGVGDYSGGSGTGGDEAAGTETWAFQWDLRGLDVESFEVNFTVYPHSSTRGLRIDQSDQFLQVVAVPEPSTWALLAAAVSLVILRRFRSLQKGFVSSRP